MSVLKGFIFVMKILLFTHHRVFPNLHYLLSSVQHKGIYIFLYIIIHPYMEVNVDQQLHSLKYHLLCEQKKETHAGEEQLLGE